MTRLRLRKRNIGVLAFFLLAVMILMLVSPMMVHAGEFDNARDFYNINEADVVYNNGYFYYATRGGKGGSSTNTTHWRTLGFRWRITNSAGSAYIYFTLSDNAIDDFKRYESSSYIYHLYRIKYEDVKDKLLSRNTSVYREFLKSGATITVDSCMTTVNIDSKGRETINGTMNSNGGTTGKAYYTYAGIAGAANWSNPSSLKSYFNKVVKFRVSLPKDTTAPSGYFTPNSASWTNGDISPKFTPTDSGSGVDRWRYRRYTNGSWGSWSGWNWSVASGFAKLPQGTHRYQVQVRDKAGNIGTVTSGYYYIDKTAPTVTASPSTRDWGNTNVTVKLTYKDTGGSGLNVQQCVWSTSTTRPTSWANYSNYPNGVSNASSGIHYLHYRVTDMAGNAKTGYFGPYKVDKIAPDILLSQNPTTWTNQDVDITAIAKDSLSGMKDLVLIDGPIDGNNLAVNTNSRGWSIYNKSVYTDAKLTFRDEENTTIIKAENTGTADRMAVQQLDKELYLKTGETYTLSFEVRGNINKLDYNHLMNEITPNQGITSIDLSNVKDSEWTRVSTTFTKETKHSPRTNVMIGVVNPAKGDWFEFKNVKVEKGSTATDWEPSNRDSLAGDGKNLVLKSNTPANSTEYRVTGYDMSTDWAAGETWTVTIKGKVNSGQRFGVWGNGSQTRQTYLTDIGGNIHTATFTVREPVNTGENAGPRKLNIYNYPNTTAKSSSIEWVKLEKGSKRSNWSPAPADIISGFANRNLLRDSATLALIGSDYPTKINSTFNNNTGVGKIAVNGTGTINAYRFGTIANNDIYNDVGEKYTASIDVKASGSGNYTFAIDTRNASNGERTNSTFAKIPMTNEWTRISAEFIVPNNDASRTLFIFRSNNASAGDAIEYRNIKLEKGSATAHSLAPEDAEKSATYTVDQNGTYTFLATDKVGNMSEKSIKVSNIDKIAPTIVYTPNEKSWTNKDVPVDTKVKDIGSGVKWIHYRIRLNNKWGSWFRIDSDKVDTINFSAGERQIETEVCDKAGNITSKVSGIYQIDKMAPDIQASPQFFRDWDNTDVKIMLHFNDAGGSGISTRQYAWSTSTTTPTNWNSYSNDVIQTSNGIWYLHAKATDVAGNVTIRRFGPYKIDKEDPVFNKDEDFKVEARYVEGENNYWIRANDTAKLRLKGIDTVSGIRQSYIRAYDKDEDIRSLHDWSTGNKNHNNNFMTGDKLSFIAAKEVYNNGPTKEVSFTAKSSDIDTDFDLYYYFKDNAGNYIGYGDTGKNLRIDVDAPIVTAIPERTIKPTHGDWENKSSGVSVQLIYKDHRSGVKTRQYAWSKSKTAPTSWSNYTRDLQLNEEGVWYLHYKTTDNVDNERIGYFGPYKIDKTAPTGIVSKGFDGEILSVSAINVVDNLSGVKRVWLTVSDGSKTVEKTLVKNAKDATKFSGQVNINEEFARSKTVTLRVYAEDIAGNIRQLKSDVFDTFTVNATVRRVLDGDRNEPYIPTFRNGEAGVLEIKTTGFVQELVVVFPDGLVDNDEGGVGVKEKTIILRKDKTDESVTYGKSDEDQYVFFVPLREEYLYILFSAQRSYFYQNNQKL